MRKKNIIEEIAIDMMSTERDMQDMRDVVTDDVIKKQIDLV